MSPADEPAAPEEAPPGDGLRVVNTDTLPSEPSRAPSPFSLREGRMIMGFDVLWCLGAVLVWGLPLAAAATLPLTAYELFGPLAAAAILPLAYVAFLVALTLVLGALKALLPKEVPGTSRVFVDRAFFVFLLHWGLEKYVPVPFITHIQLLTGLRALYYRLMGAQVSWSSHISPGAQIWNPGLMRLGHLTYIGDFVHLSGHLSQGDKLILAPIVVGDRTNIGAHSNVAPGCLIGSDVRIGALCDLAPGAQIGDDVELGPRCVLGMSVKVGAGSKLEPRTFLPSWSTVPPGEIWAGDPAHKVGDVRMTKGEERRRKRRRGE